MSDWKTRHTHWALNLLLTPAFAVWAGYVISVLWRWFLEPIGAPHIGLAHAVGIDAIVSFIAQPTVHLSFMAAVEERLTDVERDQAAGNKFFGKILWPAWVLGIGWVAHYFMVKP